jgi:hypothetical protein
LYPLQSLQVSLGYDQDGHLTFYFGLKLCPIIYAPIGARLSIMTALAIAGPSRAALTETEKIHILHHHLNGLGPVGIGREVGRPESTIRAFLKSHAKHGVLSPRRGRPFTQPIPSSAIDGAMTELERDPHLSVRVQAQVLDDHMNLNRTRLWELRHQRGYHFYKDIPVCDLTIDHKIERVRFCANEMTHPIQMPIVFTDESTVQCNMHKGGIWRKRGVRIPEGFVVHDAHPVQVMIWGGISRDGYRTPLIRCPPSVNGGSYIQFLAENRIIFGLNQQFGVRRYIFQQDNAPAHGPHRDLLEKHMILLDWPAKSPDLSPIEHVWSYMKRRLHGRKFVNPDELFAALVEEWNKIPDSVIDNFVSSFHARCVVCHDIGGESLNGHWAEVRKVHHDGAGFLPPGQNSTET